MSTYSDNSDQQVNYLQSMKPHRTCKFTLHLRTSHTGAIQSCANPVRILLHFLAFSCQNVPPPPPHTTTIKNNLTNVLQNYLTLGLDAVL